MLAIRTRDLTKIYPGAVGKKPRPSLDGLNLEIGENEVFGFLGRNGAGKTTTIKILCGLLKPTRGKAFLFEQPASNRLARANVGYLPENPYFYEYLTPRETIDFYGRLNNLPAARRREEWERICDLLELKDMADQRVREFSKGMRQRLGFAAALVGDPDLLILDEPMSGLDPVGRRQFRDLILRLRARKKTIFFSSHVLSDVEQICDRVGILVQGRLAIHGRLEQLLTGHIQEVEVIISSLPADAARKLTHVPVRRSEAGDHFLVDGLEAANALVRAAHELDGRLVEFNPVRQSLEEYFVRVPASQEALETVR